MYIRLKLSPLGPDFTPERFLTTPVRTLGWLLERLSEHEQNQHNLASVSVAHLNNQLMWASYGMGGGKGPKPQAKVVDFLPFPEAAKPTQPNSIYTNKEALNLTRESLRRALSSGRIPYDIFITLWRGPNQ